MKLLRQGIVLLQTFIKTTDKYFRNNNKKLIIIREKNEFVKFIFKKTLAIVKNN